MNREQRRAMERAGHAPPPDLPPPPPMPMPMEPTARTIVEMASYRASRAVNKLEDGTDQDVLMLTSFDGSTSVILQLGPGVPAKLASLLAPQEEKRQSGLVIPRSSV